MASAQVVLVVIVVVLMCSMLKAGEPTTAPSADKKAGDPAAAYALTPMRVQQLKGAETFVYTESQTTFADLKQTIDKLMKPLDEARNTGKYQPEAGGLIFVYSGVAGDMSKPFILQIGQPAQGEAKPGGMVKVRKLDALRAATVVYNGSLTDIGKSYEKAYAELTAAGLTPSGENREIYAYWEGPDSVNNVIIIQVGVK